MGGYYPLTIENFYGGYYPIHYRKFLWGVLPYYYRKFLWGGVLQNPCWCTGSPYSTLLAQIDADYAAQLETERRGSFLRRYELAGIGCQLAWSCAVRLEGSLFDKERR